MLGAILGLAAHRTTWGGASRSWPAIRQDSPCRFLLTAYAAESFFDWFKKFRPIHADGTAGWRCALVLVGLLMVSGQFTRLAGWLQAPTPDALRRWL
jgi:hypothetical protein